MQQRWFRKVTQMGTSLAIAVPPAMLREIGAERGDTVVLSVLDNGIIQFTSFAKFVESLPADQKALPIIHR